MSDTENDLSRRKLLARLGGLAAVAYAAPGFTTMSMAHAQEGSAASEASAPTDPSEPSEPSEPSDPSQPSEPSEPSIASTPTRPSLPSTVSGASGCEEIGGTFNAEENVCRVPQ